MNTFQIGDKVRIMRKPENGNTFGEVGRGMVVGLTAGKHFDYIKYIDRDWFGLPQDFAEVICINAPSVSVVKW